MTIESASRSVNRALRRLSRPQVFAVAALCVAAVGVADYLVGTEVSLSVFYLGPVAIATWYAGRKSGILIALLSTLTVLAADLADSHLSRHPAIVVWDGFLHLGFMLVVAHLLDRLRALVDIEHELARSDPVTGILNRRAFIEHLQTRLDLAARHGKPMTLAYIDLDDFKHINDRGGHSEGDRVLKLFADTMTESIRRTDVVARLGGDEFGLLMADADRTGAESVIAKLRQALLQAFEGERSAVTCSVGCVTFEVPPPDSDAAIRAADRLMYRVKGQGKDAVAFEVFGDRVSP